MNKIKNLHLNDFKFFAHPAPELVINGCHVLLYGENGSGKSSIYSALQTFLESSYQPMADIDAYFGTTAQAGNKSLLNIHAQDSQNAFVQITLQDNTPYKIAVGTAQSQAQIVQKSHYASDFLNYRFLFKLHSFKAQDRIDLFPLFEAEILPFVQISVKDIFVQGTQTPIRNAREAFLALRGDIKIKGGKPKERVEEDFVALLKGLVDSINQRGNLILNEKLGYQNSQTRAYQLEFLLEIANIEIAKDKQPAIHFKIKNYYGNSEDKIPSPQSFLNEAKWSAIGLAIRLAVLEYRLQNTNNTLLAPQILVLDDLMISLDMSNRDKVLQLIFSDYLPRYHVFILTHDRVFFELVRFYINQNSSINDWEIFEMFVGKDDNSPHEYPVIIPSKANYAEKAQSYFEAKDYTACAFYLRKEVERLVKQRLTEEVKRTFEEKQKAPALEHLWKCMVERYETLKSPIDETIKTAFNFSKRWILNAQSHDNLDYPVYKAEIEKAMALMQAITALPIPRNDIWFTEDTQFRFKHPTKNYTFDFALVEVFATNNLNVTNTFPQCKVLHWQYNGINFWDSKSGKSFSDDTIKSMLNDKYTIDVIFKRISLSFPEVNKAMFLANIQILQSSSTLGDILTKVGISI